MDATADQLETLDTLQDLDRKRLQAKHMIENLPQRAQVMQLQAKRNDIEAKLVKVEALYSAADHEMMKLNTEDEQVATKQAATQAKIDEDRGDYRSVTSLTRDLEGMMKRRETLEFEMNKADKKLSEIGAVRTQAQAALARIAAKEQALIGAYRNEGGKLQEQIAQYEAQRTSLARTLPAGILEAYEAAAKRCGGVGLAHLRENGCSACRSVIETNRLLVLKRDAPIATCPNCHRLLIIE